MKKLQKTPKARKRWLIHPATKIYKNKKKYSRLKIKEELRKIREGVKS